MEIVLATINCRYTHASLALRSLYANLGSLQPHSQIAEFTLSQNPSVIAEMLLAKKTSILGLGVYIWNARQTLDLVKILRAKAPEMILVLGGPEVSYESEIQEICQLANCVIKGEADLEFFHLCQKILSGKSFEKFIQAKPPLLQDLASAYAFYTDDDIRHRTIYVEASRGCPYTCEFCLSSLDQGVRNAPLENFFQDLERLLARGARQFKFIDRTFNLNPRISSAILRFFLEHIETKGIDLFLHFEMVPDRLPQELKDLIVRFPQGSLQFEIGIQTFNPEVSALISRRQDYQNTRDNFAFLLQHTGVYVHADLIAGLPGEDEASFARGFDQLLSWHPHEIQVGILKRLKGTPIIRHDGPWQMVYEQKPPFQVLETKLMDRQTLIRINRFAKFWDRIANSGRFPQTLHFLKQRTSGGSFYQLFMSLSEFLFARFQRTHSIDLNELARGIEEFLITHLNISPSLVEELMTADLPPSRSRKPNLQGMNLPKRQRRHLDNSQRVEN